MADQTATVLQHCQQGFPGLPMLLGLPGYIRRTTHPAAEAGSEIEPAGIQGIEILADHREQPPKMDFRACRVGMELGATGLPHHKC